MRKEVRMRVSASEVKFAAVGIWLFAIIYICSTRLMGAFGVETDWYGCYAPQALEFGRNFTIPIDDFRGPLYQITLGAVGLVVNDLWRAAQFINIASALVCIWFVGEICKHLKLSDNATLLTTLALILTPAFTGAAIECGTDMFFLAIVVSSLYAIMTERAILAGVLISLAILTRSNAVALLLPALLMKRWGWVPIVATAIIAWGLFTQWKTGDFFHNLNYLNTVALVTPSGKLEELWYSGAQRPDGWLDLISLQYVGAIFNNAQAVIGGIITKLWFFPLSLLGLYGLALTEDNTLFLYGLFAVPLLFLIAFDVRYALTLTPLFAIGLGKLCDSLYTPVSEYY